MRRRRRRDQARFAHPEISVAFGIDENTALVVDGDRATVVGESAVVVVDGRSARSATDRGARALRVTLVGSGDRVDLGTLDVTTEGTPRGFSAGPYEVTLVPMR